MNNFKYCAVLLSALCFSLASCNSDPVKKDDQTINNNVPSPVIKPVHASPLTNIKTAADFNNFMLKDNIKQEFKTINDSADAEIKKYGENASSTWDLAKIIISSGTSDDEVKFGNSLKNLKTEYDELKNKQKITD
ncbi:hypothetical protein [Candidatus Liberibacter sp.]|uniref:hypothetical protein n=1 Tax=Candidatus Liberibacter sp. TaxID=34022 RepID=UPI0015F62077|nr:hypothetical protein [Candidatus Liberibacter sp.]MBA5723895.1 hypothetical protein [Candidatus Liberibacter sp.]